MRLILPLLLVLFTGCAKIVEMSSDVSQVSLTFGDRPLVGRRAITANSLTVSNLVIETIPVCGGAPSLVSGPASPVTNLPVCTANLATYPRITTVDVEIVGQGQGARKYSLDFSHPELFPAEIALERVLTGTAVVYRLRDKGGAIESYVDLVTLFAKSQLAVEYQDQHFLESVTQTALVGDIVRISFRDCATCVVSTSETTLPPGFAIAANEAGYVDIDPAGATEGNHKLVLVIKKSASGTDSVRANVTVHVGGESLRVFASSVAYNGNLGGIAGANQKCQSLAQAAGILSPGKKYIALLNNETGESVMTRAKVSSRIVLTNGVVVSRAGDGEFWNANHRAAINYDERGNLIPAGRLTWSNVYGPTGQAFGAATCNSWTSGTASFFGFSGDTAEKDFHWYYQETPTTHFVAFPCNELHSLYCLEQVE